MPNRHVCMGCARSLADNSRNRLDVIDDYDEARIETIGYVCTDCRDDLTRKQSDIRRAIAEELEK